MSLFLQGLGKDALRKALGGDPFFSAPRSNPVPFMQNTNIRLPVSDVEVAPQVQAAIVRPQNERPMALEARTNVRSAPVQQNKRPVAVPAGRPSRRQEVRLGQIQPEPVVRQQAVLPIQDTQPKVASAMTNTVNDRLLNNVRPEASAASVAQQQEASKQECTFQIPSFLLPGQNPNNIASDQSCPSFLLPGPKLNRELVTLMVQHFTGIENSSSPPLNGVKSQITQVEFEQKCLVPALRAHVFGGAACKTRELKIYLEWLLYLRQKLFNI